MRVMDWRGQVVELLDLTLVSMLLGASARPHSSPISSLHHDSLQDTTDPA